jgi:hypothetical protein
MKRSIRRQQKNAAKLRRLNILATRGGGIPEKPWKNLYVELLNEPGWHTHEFVVRPARVRSNLALRLLVRGRDPETLDWPNYRKPHIYYW